LDCNLRDKSGINPAAAAISRYRVAGHFADSRYLTDFKTKYFFHRWPGTVGTGTATQMADPYSLSGKESIMTVINEHPSILTRVSRPAPLQPGHDGNPGVQA
jgi:hypothetical protein